jgi:3-hydroxyisobutyrate dehydrogenase-like beta-hydroxyacid dehydrogenase
MAGETVGFIGLGKMGALMAARFLTEGRKLVVFDTNADAAVALEKKGAVRAQDVQQVADQAEIVFASLPTPDVVHKVALGEGGVAGGKARIFVDLSTTGPKVAKTVALGLREKGIAMVDAPVSGGMAGARDGKLTLMVSCPESVFEEVQPLLSIMGTPVFVGAEPGAGQIMKLANNLLAAGALAMTAEALVFGVKGGLDPAIMCEVFNKSSGRNTATVDKFPRAVLTGSFDFGFSTGLCYKDVKLCLDEAEALGIPTPVGNAIRHVLAVTQAEYGPDSDFTSMIRPFETWANVTARSPAAPKEA